MGYTLGELLLLYESKGNILLLIWTICFLIGQKLSYFSFHKIKRERLIPQKVLLIKQNLLFGITIISLISVIYRIYEIGFLNIIFLSSNSSLEYWGMSPTVSMMISNILKACTYFGVVLSYFCCFVKG